jgi:hypothetical protein
VQFNLRQVRAKTDALTGIYKSFICSYGNIFSTSENNKKKLNSLPSGDDFHISTNAINLLEQDTDLPSMETEVAPLDTRPVLLHEQWEVNRQFFTFCFFIYFLFFFQSVLFPVVLLKPPLSFQFLDLGHHFVFESIPPFFKFSHYLCEHCYPTTKGDVVTQCLYFSKDRFQIHWVFAHRRGS